MLQLLTPRKVPIDPKESDGSALKTQPLDMGEAGPLLQGSTREITGDSQKRKKRCESEGWGVFVRIGNSRLSQIKNLQFHEFSQRPRAEARDPA